MNTVIALGDTHAVWQVVLGMGVVVLIVVTILLMLLLSFVKDIEASVAGLLDTAGVVAAHTANLPKLAATPVVLDLIIEEAVVQLEFLTSLKQPFVAAGGDQ